MKKKNGLTRKIQTKSKGQDSPNWNPKKLKIAAVFVPVPRKFLSSTLS